MTRNKASLILIAALLSVLLLSASAKSMMGGTVRGTVTPPAGGLTAFLFSAKDTISVNVVSGSFQFSNAPAGNYKLLIEAAPPYRNAVKDGIRVVEGEYTDAGQIELQKQ